ncbi:MAG: alanine racemase [Ilumatobacteraceae bacterium]|jgi:alanine racemase|nr:alanine racemase [Ilumatobacteraceae bacterium]
MTLRLVVDEGAWRRHVQSVVDVVPRLVPVVKGNGYGFGRTWLAAEAARFADVVAVGTAHELRGLPSGLGRVVLTPTLEVPDDEVLDGAILTVGAPEHVTALTPGRQVLVKLRTSMGRYGRGPELIEQALHHGLDVVGVSLHPPLVGDAATHAAEITDLVAAIDPALEVWVSHLDPATFATLPGPHRYRLRLGTQLWHGDKSMLRLEATVLDVRAVRAGEHVGYRGVEVPVAGTLVLVAAGSAHGVQPLPGGLSPFHFGQRRIDLVEAPHMHTSMLLVPAGLGPVPDIGDRVDVQRPLTTTWVDEVVWR